MARMDLSNVGRMFEEMMKRLEAVEKGNMTAAESVNALKMSFSKIKSETADTVTSLKETKSAVDSLSKANGVLTDKLNESGGQIKTLSKQNETLAKSYTTMKEKVEETAAQVKKANADLATSFKATTKDMAAMLREAFMGGSGKGKNKDSIKNFFTSQFSGLATAITSELKNLKLNTVSIGLDIGESLQKGLAAGVKGGASKNSMGIGDLVQGTIENQLARVQRKVNKEIKKIAAEIGLQTTEGLAAAMKKVAEGRRATKNIIDFDIFNKWGSPENRSRYKNAFKEQMNDLKAHLKDVEKMTENHGLKLTYEQRDRNAKIQALAKQAEAAAKAGMAGGSKIAGMNVAGVTNINKEIAELKEKQKVSLQHITDLHNAWKKNRQVEISDALRVDKVDEMLMQQRIQRQQKLTKMISSDVKIQMQELNKLTTGQSSGKATSGLGKKKSDFTVKTDEEAAILRHVQFLNQAMKNLRNNERISFDERKAMAKEFSDQYKQGTAQLVNLINERVAAEKEAAKKQAEIAAGQIKQQRDKQQFEADQLKNINAALKANQRDFEKAESDKLKARQEFSEYHLKAEQKLQEELRRLTGRFTEKEKYTKSKKYLELSMNDQVKAEVEQAKKIETIMKAYERARGRSTRGNDMDAYYQKSADALLAYAQKEKAALQEMIYGRLNANKMISAEQKRNDKEKSSSTANQMNEERRKNKELESLNRNRLRKQKEDEKAAANEYKRIQKEQAAAAKQFSKSWDGLFESIGLGWRNRNVMESFQQLAHGLRRFGHDIGVMAQQVASRIVALGATMAAFGASVAASLAYATKQVYDFGANVVQTTEEVRGYNIALYGMMNTQSGVNEMMKVAEKVTKDMPIGFKTIQESVKGLVLIGPVRDMLKNTQDIEKVMGSLFKIVVGLAQIQPEWGAKGAIFSLRNALTGDLRSLQRRFELPVRAIYSAEGVPLQDLQYQPEKMVETLDTYISSFYSEETLKMSSNQFSAILEKINGSWVKFLSSVGEGGFYDAITEDFAKVREFIQSFVDGKDFSKITDQISDSMASMYTSVKNIASYIGGYIGKVFGVDDVKDVNKLGEAFRYMAAMVHQVEVGVTSGAIAEVFKNLGNVINEKIVKPVSYVKDLILDMGSDAIQAFNKVSMAVKSVFSDTEGGLGGMLQNKAFQKGLLWTLFFGPSNVSMLLGSMALLLNSTVGLFINMTRTIIKTIAVIKDAWLLAFSVPFLKIPMLAATAVIAINSGMITPLAKSLKGVFESLITWFVDQMMIAWAKINKEIPVFEKLFGRPSYRVFENQAAKDKEIADLTQRRDALLPKETIGMPQSRLKQFGNWFGQTAPVRGFTSGVSSLLGATTNPLFQAGWDKWMGLDKLKEIENFNYAIEEANRGIIAASPKDHLEHIVDASGDLANVFVEQMEGIIGADLIQKVRDVGTGAKEFANALMDGNQFQMGLNKDLNKYAVVVGGELADVKNLKAGATSGISSVIGQMEAMGFAPMITSGYRSNSTAHKSGLAVDIQALNKSMMNDELFEYLGGLKKQGVLRRIIAEQRPGGKRFDFSNPAFADNGIETMSQVRNKKTGKLEAVQSRGHLHLVFAENAEDQMSSIYDSLTKAYEDTVKNTSLFKLPDFESRFKEKGPEYEKTLLTLYSDLENNYMAVSEGMKQFTRKTTDIVTQAFEEFKDDTGHTFGPDRIRSMEAQIKKTNQEREDLMAQIQFDEGLTPGEAQVRMYNKLTARNQGQSEGLLRANLGSTLPKMVSPNLNPIATLLQVGKGLQLMDSQLEIGTRQAQDLAYNFERVNEEAVAMLQNVIKFSSDRFIDSELAKGFEMLIVDMDMVGASFERNFNQKASLEALRMSLMQFSDSAVSASDFEKSLTNITQNMNLYQMSLEKAIENELDNTLLVGDKKVMLEKILDTYKKIYTEAKNTLGPIEKQRNEYAKMTIDLKKMTIEQLKMNKAAYQQSSNANLRKAWGQEYESRIAEGIESDSLGNMFTTGIDIAMAEWDNFGTIVVNSGKTIANDLRQSFEDGFFNVMTGKLQGFREMFKSIGDSILQTIYKIIAQMAAMSATEIILGVNLQGGLSGGKSGSTGGLSGLLGSVLGGGSSSGGLGGIFSGLLGSFGVSSIAGGANKDVVSKAMNLGTGIMGAAGGIDLTSLTSAGMAGAVAGSKGSGILGALTPVKDWISANAGPLLGVAAVGSFLSQPGRVFGGTKDKTGAAYSQYTDATQQRAAMIGRRGSDAISYYMSGNDQRILQNYLFGGIGYSEWTSGDGWARGPKEKHAATDTSAYIKSLYGYYELLMSAGKAHYQKMNQINKLAETNSLESLKQQQVFDEQKLTLIKTEYERYASTSYTAADKWDKMDEYREQQLDQEYANMQLQNEIAKTVKETKYAEMTYYTFIKSMGQDTQEMAKVALEIEKMKLAELTENTLEWYNAKMSVLQSEAELANSLKESAKATQSTIDSGVKEIYKLGRNGLRQSPYYFSGGRRVTIASADPKATEYGEMEKQKERLKNGTFTNNDLVGASISTSTVRKQIGEEFVDMGEYKKGPFYPYQQMYKDTKYGNADYVETYMDGVNYGTYDFNKMTRTAQQSSVRGATYGKTLIPPEDVFHRTIYMKFYEDVEETTYDFGEKVFTNIQDAIDYVKEKLEKDAEHFIQEYSLQVETENIYKNIGNTLGNIDSSISDRMKYLRAVDTNYKLDTLMSEDEKEIAQLELGVEVANFYAELGNNISQWLKEGFLSVGDVSIDMFKTSISNGLNEGAATLYDSIRVATQKTKFKSGVASTLNNMENFDAFRAVMSGEGADAFRSIMGLEKYQEAFEDTRSVLKTGTKWTPYTYRTGGLFGGRTTTSMMQSSYNYWEQEKFTNYREVDPLEKMLNQYTDPYEFYFETMKNQIQTRIDNSEKDSDEWFAAQSDMFNLMIDNAVKMKEKAEEFNRSMEDMFGKIEETMRMRIAEERETSKGDVYFIDAGATRNSQKMLDDMLAKVQTNDPAARQLIEEFRKKMMGIK